MGTIQNRSGHRSISIWTYVLNIKKNVFWIFTCLLSADNLCKQIGPRSGLTKCGTSSGYELFCTLVVFLKDFFEKVNFEKNNNSRRQKNKQNKNSMQNFPSYICATIWDFQRCCMCDQQSLRSACTSAQSDQSLC